MDTQTDADAPTVTPPEREPYYIPAAAREAELARQKERQTRLKAQRERWQAAVDAGRRGWYGRVPVNPVPGRVDVAQ